MIFKKTLLILIALIILFSFTALIPKPTTASTVTDLSVQEAKAMIDQKPSLTVLDVRNQTEYDNGHIRNAKLIPVWQLIARLNELNTSNEILVYCQAGGRSANASQTLVNNNFTHVYNMLGGINSWTAAGYSTYTKYASIQTAINNAKDGDTIHVALGTYNENLDVNKSIALLGENSSITTINSTTTDINVKTNNASISCFTIQYTGCACYGYSAINVTNAKNANITDNIITSDDYGIYLTEAEKVTIANNSITRTGDACIVTSASTNISVLQNNITASDGIEVDNSTESEFSENTILTTRGAGIFTSDSHDNRLYRNTVTSNSSTAISISTSYNNTFSTNTVFSNNTYGLFFWQSNNNTFYHNNFQGSTGNISQYGSSNFWDNGFEGNYWTSYTGTDTNLNGLGDTPYTIDPMNKDNHPLMGEFHTFTTSVNQNVEIVSNSTIDQLQYLEPNSTIAFRASNTTPYQTVGFCRAGIPYILIDPNNGPISIIIDNGQTPVTFLNVSLSDNGTHRWIYFTYPQSTHEILILPELQTWLFLPLAMIGTILAARIHRRRHIAQ
jgi:parallel beta-helix repeat protein